MIHTIKGFSIVSEAEVDVFLELSCFLHDPTNVGNLIYGSSAFSKSSLYIWKFSIHVPLKPSLKDFEHNLTIMWSECNFTVVWTFFGIAFLWDWNENWPFQVLWPLLFSKFAGILNATLSQHHLLGFQIAQLKFCHLHYLLFQVMLPKALLTSHSRMSDSSWATTPSWFSGSLRSFLYSSSVYSCHPFLISFASVRFYHFCLLSCPSLHEIFPWHL